MSRKVAILLCGVALVWVIGLAALGTGVVALAQGNTGDARNASPFWNNLAQRLGITPDALQQAARDAAKDAVAQAVKDGKLTQAQADKLVERIDSAQGFQAFGGPLFGGPAFGRGPMGGAPMFHLGKVGLEAAATALSMTAQELMTELAGGKSLRQVAQAKGVDAAQVQRAIVDAEKAEIDKAVTAGKLTAERASQAKTRIETAVTAFMDWTHTPGARPGPGAPAGPRPGGPASGLRLQPGAMAGHEAAAQALGLSMQELQAELVKGQTLRQVAQAKGVADSTVEKAITDALTAQLDKAVADGKLKVERAEAAKSAVKATVTRLMDSPLRHFERAPDASKQKTP